MTLNRYVFAQVGEYWKILELSEYPRISTQVQLPKYKYSSTSAYCSGVLCKDNDNEESNSLKVVSSKKNDGTDITTLLAFSQRFSHRK